ncbi:MAG: sigma-70 family RNA polymerase sigma factor [Bacteroidetes bacterium]|nr:sigma-70 family RNA polymerase sigma factor [Bacteroidota bacterium]
MRENLPKQITDTEIIQKVINGDTNAFEAIIRKYDSLLYKIARGYRFNHEDSQDLMQDAYINIYKNLRKFESRSSFKTWITRIILNLCYQKRHKPSQGNEEIEINNIPEKSIGLEAFSKTVEKITENKELGKILENAVHEIPENYRMVFILREVNGLSIAETAEILSLTESNVKVRLSRAKAMLKNEISKTYNARDIFEFNLIYCDAMVHNVMAKIKQIVI